MLRTHRCTIMLRTVFSRIQISLKKLNILTFKFLLRKKHSFLKILFRLVLHFFNSSKTSKNQRISGVFREYRNGRRLTFSILSLEHGSLFCHDNFSCLKKNVTKASQSFVKHLRWSSFAKIVNG